MNYNIVNKILYKSWILRMRNNVLSDLMENFSKIINKGYTFPSIAYIDTMNWKNHKCCVCDGYFQCKDDLIEHFYGDRHVDMTLDKRKWLFEGLREVPPDIRIFGEYLVFVQYSRAMISNRLGPYVWK